MMRALVTLLGSTLAAVLRAVAHLLSTPSFSR